MSIGTTSKAESMSIRTFWGFRSPCAMSAAVSQGFLRNVDIERDHETTGLRRRPTQGVQSDQSITDLRANPEPFDHTQCFRA